MKEMNEVFEDAMRVKIDNLGMMKPDSTEWNEEFKDLERLNETLLNNQKLMLERYKAERSLDIEEMKTKAEIRQEDEKLKNQRAETNQSTIRSIAQWAAIATLANRILDYEDEHNITSKAFTIFTRMLPFVR